MKMSSIGMQTFPMKEISRRGHFASNVAISRRRVFAEILPDSGNMRVRARLLNVARNFQAARSLASNSGNFSFARMGGKSTSKSITISKNAVGRTPRVLLVVLRPACSHPDRIRSRRLLVAGDLLPRFDRVLLDSVAEVVVARSKS